MVRCAARVGAYVVFVRYSSSIALFPDRSLVFVPFLIGRTVLIRGLLQVCKFIAFLFFVVSRQQPIQNSMTPRTLFRLIWIFAWGGRNFRNRCPGDLARRV
jgi:hypothetical protein